MNVLGCFGYFLLVFSQCFLFKWFVFFMWGIYLNFILAFFRFLVELLLSGLMLCESCCCVWKGFLFVAAGGACFLCFV